MERDDKTEGTLTSPESRGQRAVPARGDQLDRYVILERVGEGGMGVVFSAYDSDLDRKVALKLLRKEGSDRARARLLSEAKSMARLTDPNVVTIYNVGSSAGRDYIAMEFASGPTLASWLREQRKEVEGGRKTALEMASETIGHFIAAGRGLAAAHRVGVIHRDFKPSNVLINDEGRVMVTDFGVARHLDDDEPNRPDGRARTPRWHAGLHGARATRWRDRRAFGSV